MDLHFRLEKTCSVVYHIYAYLQRKSKSCWRIKSVSCYNLLDHWVSRMKVPICFPLLLFWSPGLSFRQVLRNNPRPRDMSRARPRSAGSRRVSVSSRSCGMGSWSSRKHAMRCGKVWKTRANILKLVGGLEHALFFHILGIIIPIDFHIFQRDSNDQSGI